MSNTITVTEDNRSSNSGTSGRRPVGIIRRSQPLTAVLTSGRIAADSLSGSVEDKDVDSRVTELAAEAAVTQKTAARLMAEKAAAEELFIAAKKDVSRLRKEILDRDDLIHTLEEELRARTDAERDTREAELRHKCEQLSEASVHAALEKAAFEQALSELIQAVEEAGSRIERLEGDKRDAREEIDRLLEEMHTERQRAALLQSRYENLDSAYQEKCDDNLRLEQRVITYEVDLSAAEEAFRSQSSDSLTIQGALRSEINEVRAALVLSEGRLAAALRQCQEQTALHTKEKEGLLAAVSDASNRAAAIMTELEEEKLNGHSSAVELHTANSQLQACRSDLDAVRRQLAMSTDRTESEQRIARDQIRTLENRLVKSQEALKKAQGAQKDGAKVAAEKLKAAVDYQQYLLSQLDGVQASVSVRIQSAVQEANRLHDEQTSIQSARIAELEDTIRRLTLSNEELVLNNSCAMIELRDQLERVQSVADETSRRAETLSERLAAAERTAHELTLLLESKDNEAVAMKTLLDKMSNEKCAAEQMSRQCIDEVGRLKDEKTVLEGVVVGLQADKNELALNVDQLRLSLTEIQGPLFALRGEMSAARRQQAGTAALTPSSAQGLNIRRSLSFYSSYTASSVHSPSSSPVLGGANVQDSSLQQTALKVKLCLESCSDHLHSIRKQLSFKYNEVQTKDGQISSLSVANSRLEAEIVRLEASRAAQDVAVASLEKLLETFQSPPHDENGANGQEEEDMKMELLRLQEVVNSLEVENKNSVQAVSELQDQLEAAEQSKEWLNRQFVSKSVEACELEGHVTRLRSSLEVNARHLEELRGQLEEKSRELADKQRVIALLEAEKISWTAENIRLSAAVKSHDAVISGMIGRLQRLSMAIAGTGEALGVDSDPIGAQDDVDIEAEKTALVRSCEADLAAWKSSTALFMSAVEDKEARVEALFMDLQQQQQQQMNSPCASPGLRINTVSIALAEALDEERRRSLQTMQALDAALRSHENTVMLLQAEAELATRRYRDGAVTAEGKVTALVGELCALQQGKMMMEARLEALEDEKNLLSTHLLETQQRAQYFHAKILSLDAVNEGAGAGSNGGDMKSTVSGIRGRRVDELKQEVARLEETRRTMESSMVEMRGKLKQLEVDNAVLRDLDGRKVLRIEELMRQLRAVEDRDHTTSSRAVLGLSSPKKVAEAEIVPSLEVSKSAPRSKNTSSLGGAADAIASAPPSRPRLKLTPPRTQELQHVVSVTKKSSPVPGPKSNRAVLRDITNSSKASSHCFTGTLTPPTTGQHIKALTPVDLFPASNSRPVTPLPSSTPVRKQAALIQSFIKSANGGAISFENSIDH